ncbi:hypothetical protein PRIPAC_73444 [Pristionchus pacificus]|uniref:Branched-chain-amino-acid aminotransferase n=1 Tax=Pristionchus pacificus TaxID=54126 RepID=A0A2A6C568_PRIPA|nr:hypothetical protein PRIPAC_73444 [Pristionchus pacificus]|eukprot:PDM73280.1 hypothetical protein PRIPAC_40636 [Pristionchus pacificus]
MAAVRSVALLTSRSSSSSAFLVRHCSLTTSAPICAKCDSTAPAARSTPAEKGHAKDHARTFYRAEMVTTPALPSERAAKPPAGDSTLPFGAYYSDHMIDVDWTMADGWGRPRLHRIQPLQLHPGAKVLHYAIELFEGMKAYRGVDNTIRIFRPDMNMARMNRTAARCALPTFDSAELIAMIADQIRLDREWVPSSSATSSLYIRPTLIATDKTLGVGAPHAAKLFVVTCPVGAYFPSGFQSVSLLADSQFVRAFPGGVGAYKMGCNYAPTIDVAQSAAKKGCQQVLWLSGENEELTEVGTMNIFVLWKNEEGDLELVTPPLDRGLILPGVTRDSLLALGREYGEFKRAFTMEDVRAALKQDRLLQMFGAGTACVVSPVGEIVYHNRKTGSYETWAIPTMSAKPNLMQRFYDHITDIQYGRTDRPEWVYEVRE